MKKLQVKILAAFLVLLAFSSVCFADTVTHRKTGEALQGYIAGQTEDGKTILSTKEKARMELKRARGQLNRIGKAIDFKIEQSKYRHPLPKVLKILRSAKSEFQIFTAKSKPAGKVTREAQNLGI